MDVGIKVVYGLKVGSKAIYPRAKESWTGREYTSSCPFTKRGKATLN